MMHDADPAPTDQAEPAPPIMRRTATAQEFAVMQQASRIMLGWSALFCGFGAVLITLLGLVLEGKAGGLGALTTAILVLTFFVLGHVIELLTLNRADGFGLAGQLVSFVVRIVLFAVVLWLIAQSALADGTLSRLWMGLGAVVALVSWQTGMVLGHSRAKIPTIMKATGDEQ